VPQVRPLADIVHFKYACTYLLTYLLEWCGGIKKTHIKQEFTTSTASPVKTKGSKNTEDLHHTE